ncbi:MAG TPA: metal ABC transporter substrate-binding protein [Nocardioidaceae bacterium]|nr:metal ABC transporter substrate-binding protein [Nocardioidaceae bacterium]
MKALALVLLAPLLVACGGGAAGTDGGPTIVTSFYPLQYVAERIAGDHATIETLTQPGQEPHDLELSIQAVGEISDADLVVYEKGFQSAVDEAVETADPARVVDSSEGHDVEADPHVWLSPANMTETARQVESELADLDPDNAAEYSANLEAFEADMDALLEEYDAGLADCAISTVVVGHDAFRNLPVRDVTWAPISGLSPDAQPSPARLQEIRNLVESAGVTTIFSEELVSPEVAESLATDLGIEAAVLDPIEGLTDETADEDYVSLMRKNLAALRKANDCT